MPDFVLQLLHIPHKSGLVFGNLNIQVCAQDYILKLCFSICIFSLLSVMQSLRVQIGPFFAIVMLQFPRAMEKSPILFSDLAFFHKRNSSPLND